MTNTPTTTQTITLPDGYTMETLPTRIRQMVEMLARKRGHGDKAVLWDVIEVEAERQSYERITFKRDFTYEKIGLTHWWVKSVSYPGSLACTSMFALVVIPDKGRSAFGSAFRTHMIGKVRNIRTERDYNIWAGI